MKNCELKKILLAVRIESMRNQTHKLKMIQPWKKTLWQESFVIEHARVSENFSYNDSHVDQQLLFKRSLFFSGLPEFLFFFFFAGEGNMVFTVSNNVRYSVRVGSLLTLTLLSLWECQRAKNQFVPIRSFCDQNVYTDWSKTSCLIQRRLHTNLKFVFECQNSPNKH